MENGWWGTSSSTWNLGSNWPPPGSKMAISNRYSLVAPQPLDLAKKVQLWLIGSHLQAFQWAYNEQRILPLSPKRGLRNANWPFSLVKEYFSRRKSAAKFLCMKTFSGKVVRHSLAYLAVHNRWGYPLLPEIFDQSDPPPSKTAISNTHGGLITRSLAIAKRACDCCIILKSGSYTKAI